MALVGAEERWGPDFVRAVFSANFARDEDISSRAMELGLFGAPDFLVSGELFFGQDRLEDALAWLSAPSRPSAPG